MTQSSTTPLARLLLTGLALLGASASSLAQSGEGLVTIGIASTTSDGTFDVMPGQDARIVFEQAALALPDGGEIHVLPGTYTFSSTWNPAIERLRVVGSRGATLEPAASFAGTMIQSDVDGFALEGLRIHDDRPETLLGRQPLIDLTGAHLRLKDLELRVEAAPEDGSAYICIDHGELGIDSSSGLLIEQNLFLVGEQPAGAPATSGLVFFASTNSTGVRMVGNVGRSTGAGRGWLKELVFFDNSWFGTIVGNRFRRLGDDPLDGAVVHITNGRGVEGHHTTINGNVFEDCRLRRALLTSGLHGFHPIEGNVFLGGRGALGLDSGSDYAVTGNLFVDMAPATGDAVIDLISARAFVVQGNQFRGCVGRGVSATLSSHGKVLGNQFQWDAPTMPVVEPVHLSSDVASAVGFRVVGNSAIDYGSFGSSVWDSGVLFPVAEPPTSKVVSNYQE